VRSANHGFTLVIKDNIATTELPTTCASKILKGYVPSEDAFVTRQLQQAGMITLAKSNMDEFGMGSHSRYSAYGPVGNGRLGTPTLLSAGGSSGGSALAVARDLAHIGLGTDTGGSVRLPAAYMSVIGFKPSYGLISRTGVIPYAHSLDTVGILARSVLDIRLTFGRSSISNLRANVDSPRSPCLPGSRRPYMSGSKFSKTSVLDKTQEKESRGGKRIGIVSVCQLH
jgi:aspartyl-tRNA(Asn)/glutamyl-tRNA(Gln) amidotransferase subunit A